MIFFSKGMPLAEGNKFEGRTLIPTLEKYTQRFQQSKPIVVADTGLLSSENIKDLVNEGYQYILGARIKS